MGGGGERVDDSAIQTILHAITNTRQTSGLTHDDKIWTIADDSVELALPPYVRLNGSCYRLNWRFFIRKPHQTLLYALRVATAVLKQLKTVNRVLNELTERKLRNLSEQLQPSYLHHGIQSLLVTCVWISA